MEVKRIVLIKKKGIFPLKILGHVRHEILNMVVFYCNSRSSGALKPLVLVVISRLALKHSFTVERGYER